MFVTIRQNNPDQRKIREAVKCLRKGGIIIYPTDTVYGIGCDIFNNKAVERVCKLKGINPKKAHLTFMCDSISDITKYVLPFDTQVFRLIKKHSPGPFTYILKASNDVPKLFKNNKKTVGIRIPDNNIARLLVQELGRPILSTSVKNLDEENDYYEFVSDPTDIFDQYEHSVDMVLDGGYGGLEPSTVIDCTGSVPEIIRQGLGEV